MSTSVRNYKRIPRHITPTQGNKASQHISEVKHVHLNYVFMQLSDSKIPMQDAYRKDDLIRIQFVFLLYTLQFKYEQSKNMNKVCD